MFVTIKNSDIEDFFKYPKIHLIFGGYWPMLSNSKWAKIYYYYGTFLTFPMSTIICFSIFINIFFNLDTLELAADALYVLASNSNFFFKFTIFAFKQKQFKDLLKSMDNPLFLTFNEKHDEIIDNWKNFALSYTKYFCYSIYACVSLFAVFPFLDKNGNVLPLGGYIPYDIQNSSRNYAYTYTFQIIGLLFIAALNISIDLLPSVFMNIGCAQVEILKDNLKNAVINAEERTRFKRDRFSNHQFYEIEKKEIDSNIYEPLTEEVENELHKILKHCVRHHDAINRYF